MYLSHFLPVIITRTIFSSFNYISFISSFPNSSTSICNDAINKSIVFRLHDPINCTSSNIFLDNNMQPITILIILHFIISYHIFLGTYLFLIACEHFHYFTGVFQKLFPLREKLFYFFTCCIMIETIIVLLLLLLCPLSFIRSWFISYPSFAFYFQSNFDFGYFFFILKLCIVKCKMCISNQFKLSVKML